MDRCCTDRCSYTIIGTIGYPYRYNHKLVRIRIRFCFRIVELVIVDELVVLVHEVEYSRGRNAKMYTTIHIQ